MIPQGRKLTSVWKWEKEEDPWKARREVSFRSTWGKVLSRRPRIAIWGGLSSLGKSHLDLGIPARVVVISGGNRSSIQLVDASGWEMVKWRQLFQEAEEKWREGLGFSKSRAALAKLWISHKTSVWVVPWKMGQVRTDNFRDELKGRSVNVFEYHKFNHTARQVKSGLCHYASWI